MNKTKIILLLILLLPAISYSDPKVLVNWSKKRSTKKIDINLFGNDELINQCLNSGFVHQYRYELELCRRRTAWFDSCEDVRKEIHQLEFDSVSDSYKFITDRLRDKKEPIELQLQEKEEALNAMRSVKKYPLKSLNSKFPKPDISKYYLSVRVMADCKGDRSDITKGISKVLSLGLVRVQGFNTGWLDFNLGDS